MTGSNAPLLVQFAVAPFSGGGLPDGCEVRPETGMLYRAGSSTPLVEELIELGPIVMGAAETVMTHAVEPRDPDTVRISPRECLGTTLTEMLPDPADPDLLRTSGASSVDSLMTKTVTDPYDPDLLRQVERCAFDSRYTATRGETVDPDLVRATEFIC